MSLGLRRHVKCLTDVVAVGVWGLWVSFPQARTQRKELKNALPPINRCWR